VVLSPDEDKVGTADPSNSFSHDLGSMQNCPFAAHIIKTNPRTDCFGSFLSSVVALHSGLKAHRTKEGPKRRTRHGVCYLCRTKAASLVVSDSCRNVDVPLQKNFVQTY
jgi:hypothetical protein